MYTVILSAYQLEKYLKILGLLYTGNNRASGLELASPIKTDQRWSSEIFTDLEVVTNEFIIAL